MTHEQDTEQRFESFANLGRLALDHAGLLLTAATLVFVMMRLLIVARGSVPTALGLLQTGGTANIVLGSVLRDGTMSVVNLSIIGAIIWSAAAIARRRDLVAPIAFALVVVTVASFFFTLFFFLFTAALWLSFLGDAKRSRTGKQRPAPEQAAKRSYMPLLISITVIWLLATTLLTPSPWVPLERLELVRGETIIGYVFSDNGRDVVVLEDGSRLIRHIDPSGVENRMLCRKTPELDSVITKPLAFVVLNIRRPQLARC